MLTFPADLQNLVDTAISDRARAIKGVVDIAKANSELDAARQKVSDLTQIELDANNAASQSEPAAVNAFTQWLRDQATAAATPVVVDPAPAPTPAPDPAPADPTNPTV